MIKKGIVYLPIFFLLVSFVCAETSMNFLTKAFADTLYCKMGGVCEVSSLHVDNLTVTNMTVENLNVTNYEVVGDLNVTGDFCVGGVCEDIAYMSYANPGFFNVSGGDVYVDADKAFLTGAGANFYRPYASADGAGHIASDGHFRVFIDSDNTHNNQHFTVMKDSTSYLAATSLFDVAEDGTVTIYNGNLDMNSNSITNVDDITATGTITGNISAAESDPLWTSARPQVAFQNQTNVFTEDQNISASKKLYFSNNSYLFYNSTNNTIQLWANGVLQQDWGASTTVYGEATFLSSAAFQNMTGEGLTIDTNVLITGNLTANEATINGSKVCRADGTNCPAGLSNTSNYLNYTKEVGANFVRLTFRI